MRRTLLTFVAGASVAAGGTLAQSGHNHGKGAAVKVLSVVDVTEELNGKPVRASTLEVMFEPGVSSAPHRHPGPVFGTVLEGELDFQAGDGPVRRLKTGDTFYEPAMILHAVSRNPSDKVRTRVLAVMLHARDVKELVIREPAKGGK